MQRHPNSGWTAGGGRTESRSERRTTPHCQQESAYQQLISILCVFYAAKVNCGDIFVTQSGLFPCKAFFHVCGEKDSNLIEKLVGNIINQCENSGFESVAIPAICAGMYIDVCELYLV